MRHLILALLAISTVPAAAQYRPIAPARVGPVGMYRVTDTYVVPGGVHSAYLRPSDDGRYVSWADVYTRQYRILDTLTGDVHDVVTDAAALHQGGGRWIDGRLYVACYAVECDERSTWGIDPQDWTTRPYLDGAWLLGRVDGADALAIESGFTAHGWIDHPDNELWQHGYYAVEFGGGRAVYTTWGYAVAEYDTLQGSVTPLPITGQCRSSPGGTVCDWRGAHVRVGGVWHDNPAGPVGYVYAVSDDGVAVTDYGLVDLRTGALLYASGFRWGWGITADGVAWFGNWDSIERVSQ